MLNKEHLDIWLEGVYKGIELVNIKLKDLDLEMVVPSKEEILELYNQNK